MLNLDQELRVYLCTTATDMRRSFDRLAEMAREHTGSSVIQGGIYVFFSRCRSRAKLLYWDGDGYALWYKRLKVGTFKIKLSESGHEEISGVDLKLLLSGIELSRIRFRNNAKQNVYENHDTC